MKAARLAIGPYLIQPKDGWDRRPPGLNFPKKKARQTFVQRAFPQVKLYYYLIVRVHFKYFLNHIKTGLVFDFFAHTSDIDWINDF